MKQNTNIQQKRSRGRNLGKNRNGKVVTMHDGQSAVDGKSKNQLIQCMEKYLNLAREAQAGGDRILAEGFYQHADHYYRQLSQLNEVLNERRNSQPLREQKQSDSALEVDDKVVEGFPETPSEVHADHATEVSPQPI
ncbi:MAG: DUF4167 domain-containing protein [Alphaproteobacteria bacterium]|nr:DUF4167 domain-containing protein [Alphaproteobacteria bacterium]OJV47147.1 MAG: hypothetical protein BGO28_01760 [Alphaproteobacteria bacterium 43-37]